MHRFLRDNGMTEAEYDFFMDSRLENHCIMGNDYYETNEHNVSAEGETSASGETFGYGEITRPYHERYRLPIMHTEANTHQGLNGDEAVRWLRKEWANALHVRNQGMPVVGFTWYSLTDQVDWDSALRENHGRIDPLGLYDLDRKPRPVGKAYKQLIQNWLEVLPAPSRCLTVPLAGPERA